MFKLDLGARTVSAETALPCLDRVAELRGLGTAASYHQDLNEQSISLDQLIMLGRKRRIKIRPKSLSWSRLLTATAADPVLLRLNNGNMVVALRNSEANTEHVVVSDPLYENGESFFLPRDALEQVWAGDALIVGAKTSKTVQAVTWLMWILSVCGFVAGAFFLVEAIRELIGK